MPQESVAPRGPGLARLILERLRVAIRLVWSERFARALIIAVDLALAVYQMVATTV